MAELVRTRPDQAHLADGGGPARPLVDYLVIAPGVPGGRGRRSPAGRTKAYDLAERVGASAVAASRLTTTP